MFTSQDDGSKITDIDGVIAHFGGVTDMRRYFMVHGYDWLITTISNWGRLNRISRECAPVVYYELRRREANVSASVLGLPSGYDNWIVPEHQKAA